jgi:hypothetical protein
LLFEKRFGGASYEDVYDAVMLKDTSFIVVGETSSTPNQVENVYIFRVNKFGDRLWTKSIGSLFPDKAKSVKLLNDTTLYIAGEMYDEVEMKQRGMLMKMHINGTIEWTKLYGSETKHGFHDLNIFNDTIRVVGYFYDSEVNNVSNFYMSSHLLNGDEIKVNKEYHIGTYTIDFIQDYEGNFLLLKSVSGEPDIPTFDEGFDASAYYYSGKLIFLNHDFKFSYLGDDFVNQMIKTNDGGMAVLGYNSFPLNGGNNVLFAKIAKNKYYNSQEISSNLVKINLIDSTRTLIYPNPANNHFIIETEFDFENVLLYNYLQQIVLISDSSKINVKELPNGIYFLTVNGKNGELIQSKIVVQH